MAALPMCIQWQCRVSWHMVIVSSLVPCECISFAAMLGWLAYVGELGTVDMFRMRCFSPSTTIKEDAMHKLFIMELCVCNHLDWTLGIISRGNFVTVSVWFRLGHRSFTILLHCISQCLTALRTGVLSTLGATLGTLFKSKIDMAPFPEGFVHKILMKCKFLKQLETCHIVI